VTLKFEIPDGKTPGFLRREQARLEFFENYIELSPTDKVQALIEYLQPFLLEGEADDLWDATQKQISELVNAFVTGHAPGEDAEVSDPNEERPEDG